MKTLFSGSFLRTASLILAVAALPVVAIVFLTGLESNRDRIAYAQEQAVEKVRYLARIRAVQASGKEKMRSAFSPEPHARSGHTTVPGEVFGAGREAIDSAYGRILADIQLPEGSRLFFTASGATRWQPGAQPEGIEEIPASIALTLSGK